MPARPARASSLAQTAPNVLQQQARFDAFLSQFNQERPHQALQMNQRETDGLQTPIDRWIRSADQSPTSQEDEA
jgi:hypothetical protein